MLGSTECVNQAILLITFLDNIAASLTFFFFFFAVAAVVFLLLLLLLLFNQVLPCFNKCNLFIVSCSKLSTTDNPSSI